MKIVGQKVAIRNLKASDALAYYEYGKSPRVGPMAGWKPFTDLEVAKRLLSSAILSKETYALVLPNSDVLIGTISCYNTALRKYNKAKSLGFSLNENYWNQGIMTEAVKMFLSFIFTKTDCEILEVGRHSDNYASKRVIEKCGFKYDGRLCCYKRLYDGTLIDADFYSMTKAEFLRRKEYD